MIPPRLRIATADQCRHIDEQTIADFGIAGLTLMEIAGKLAANRLLDEHQINGTGLFLCGKGNNGGDALVIARYLLQHGIACHLVFISGTDDLSPAAQTNLDRLRTIVSQCDDAPLTITPRWADFVAVAAQPDFLIDGMLGTGLSSALRGDYKIAAEWCNQASAPVFALDIPTGLHADTGNKMGAAVHADHTFAFGLLKQGFYFNDGPKITGRIHHCELPFPPHIIQQCTQFLADKWWYKNQAQRQAAHKYDAGVVYIIAGSEGLTGAAILSAKSAWAAGAGAVILVCPHGLLPIFEHTLPQIIKKPVGDATDKQFMAKHLKTVQNIISEKKGHTLLGPGLGRHDGTICFVQQFLAQAEHELTIDADALWALSQWDHWQQPAAAAWTITPHPGELSHLTNQTLGHDDLQRLAASKKMAVDKNITVVSKGYPSIVARPDGRTWLTNYDTRVFARAGFGDVLAGRIAANQSRGWAPHKSSLQALIGGHEKILNAGQGSSHHPEPLDLI